MQLGFLVSPKYHFGTRHGQSCCQQGMLLHVVSLLSGSCDVILSKELFCWYPTMFMKFTVIKKNKNYGTEFVMEQAMCCNGITRAQPSKCIHCEQCTLLIGPDFIPVRLIFTFCAKWATFLRKPGLPENLFHEPVSVSSYVMEITENLETKRQKRWRKKFSFYLTAWEYARQRHRVVSGSYRRSEGRLHRFTRKH